MLFRAFLLVGVGCNGTTSTSAAKILFLLTGLFLGACSQGIALQRPTLSLTCPATSVEIHSTECEVVLENKTGKAVAFECEQPACEDRLSIDVTAASGQRPLPTLQGSLDTFRVGGPERRVRVLEANETWRYTIQLADEVVLLSRSAPYRVKLEVCGFERTRCLQGESALVSPRPLSPGSEVLARFVGPSRDYVLEVFSNGYARVSAPEHMGAPAVEFGWWHDPGVENPWTHGGIAYLVIIGRPPADPLPPGLPPKLSNLGDMVVMSSDGYDLSVHGGGPWRRLKHGDPPPKASSVRGRRTRPISKKPSQPVSKRLVKLSDGRHFDLVTECVTDHVDHSESCELPTTLQVDSSAGETRIETTGDAVCVAKSGVSRCVRIPERSPAKQPLDKGLARLLDWQRVYLPYSALLASEFDVRWDSDCTAWEVVRDRRGIRLRQHLFENEGTVDVSLSPDSVRVIMNTLAFRIHVCEEAISAPKLSADSVSWEEGRFTAFVSAAACERVRSSDIEMGCFD